MSKENNDDIIFQKRQVFNNNCKVDLNEACTLGNGIIRLDSVQTEKAIGAFLNLDRTPCFFVPASGSGSRMFEFLFEWMEDGIERVEVDKFFDQLEIMPFYSELSGNKSIDLSNRKQVVAYLLSDEGLNLANKPKGLIPFHIDGDKVYNAFQEHARQAVDLFPHGCEMHFTIQKEYENEIEDCLLGLQIPHLNFTFSYQNESTDAYCFNSGENLIEYNGAPLRRPAGHGALLQNLNGLKNDLALIKNNVQHTSKSKLSTETWKSSIGFLLNFKTDLIALSNDFSKENLFEFNREYQVLSSEEMKTSDDSILTKLISRPTRVCGMVKNEGEPGGGPFWINDNGLVTKQIIEKVQISNDEDQQEILEKSSHFNPVFMMVSKSDAFNRLLDLQDFVDDSKCFVVQKTHMGEPIMYRELPGLWNGSMSNWNTIFIEIPSEVFSPVKTINDLSKRAHKA